MTTILYLRLDGIGAEFFINKYIDEHCDMQYM